MRDRVNKQGSNALLYVIAVNTWWQYLFCHWLAIPRYYATQALYAARAPKNIWKHTEVVRNWGTKSTRVTIIIGIKNT
jgi:hypothetical protein